MYKEWKQDTKLVPTTYLSRFLSLNSAANMLELELFPKSNTIKEIAESMSMWYAVERHIMPIDQDVYTGRGQSDINLIVVGDGTKPRTAALFAYMTKWNCWSIDPIMTQKEYPIKRLTIISNKIEDIDPIDFGDQITIIIMPHSHALTIDCWNKFESTRKWLVKLECCTHDKLPFTGIYYKDMNAITPANDVYIWNNYK